MSEIEMTEPQTSSEEAGLITLQDAPRKPEAASQTLKNYIRFSICFAAVPSSALACLALASPRLHSVGSKANGILYLAYTASAVMGATYITKRIGSRNAIVIGMALFCSYVLCFLIATVDPQKASIIAYVGAAIGGIGAGIQWTAQGTYFSQAAEAYSLESGQDWALSNAKLAGIFAFIFLTEETILDLMSTLFIRTMGLHWSLVFAIYSAIALVATFAVTTIQKYPTEPDEYGAFHKVTVASRLLLNDNKMKYMVGMNAAFGFAGAFLNSFVSGEVIPVALHDTDSSYTGVLVALHGGAAALSSLLFASISAKIGKGPILVLGSLCFFSVAFPFLIQPDLKAWNWKLLITVYVLEGVGRATFEGTLKALFADYFAYEKEGAFANIILQNGLSTAIAYLVATSLTCDRVGVYCVEYRDGSRHDVFSFAMIVVITSLLSILGFLRAAYLYEVDDTDNRLSSYRTRSILSYRSSLQGSIDRKTYESIETIRNEFEDEYENEIT